MKAVGSNEVDLAAPVPAVGGRVTVASYNIHRCIGTDGVRDPRRTADVIQTLGADVIALQEVDIGPGETAEGAVQMEFLAHTVGLHAISGPTMQRGEGHYGNVLLTRLPVLDVRKLDLTVFRREPRGALDVDLDVAGARLRVMATHLGLMPGERRWQVQRILEAVEGDNRVVTVLLGDINEWFVHGRPLRWLHARFGQGAGGRTYPSRFPLLKLDRIWARPQGVLRNFTIHVTPLSRQASDHLPVSAEIAVSPEARSSGAAIST